MTHDDNVLLCEECGIEVDALDGVSVDGFFALCGSYTGNGCGDRYYGIT